MKKSKYFILIIGLFFLFFSFWFFGLKDNRENRLINEGNALVEKIEAFRVKNNRLPNSLVEIGLEERDGIDVLYYDKRDSLNYTISFGTSLGESKFYYSDNKKWENSYRTINNP